jgi:hypothetical protein
MVAFLTPTARSHAVRQSTRQQHSAGTFVTPHTPDYCGGGGVAGEDLSHVDMFAQNKSDMAFQDKGRWPGTFTEVGKVTPICD